MTKSSSSSKARASRGRRESGLPGDLPPIGLNDSLHRSCLRQVASETTTTTTTTTTTQASPFLLCYLCARWTLAGSPRGVLHSDEESNGSAPCLRHGRMTVAMALAESTHHSSRGQRTAKAGTPPLPHTPAGALQPLCRRARRVAARQDRFPVWAAGAGSAAHRAADCRHCPSGAVSR